MRGAVRSEQGDGGCHQAGGLAPDAAQGDRESKGLDPTGWDDQAHRGVVGEEGESHHRPLEADRRDRHGRAAVVEDRDPQVRQPRGIQLGRMGVRGGCRRLPVHRHAETNAACGLGCRGGEADGRQDRQWRKQRQDCRCDPARPGGRRASRAGDGTKPDRPRSCPRPGISCRPRPVWAQPAATPCAWPPGPIGSPGDERGSGPRHGDRPVPPAAQPLRRPPRPGRTAPALAR